MTKTKINSLTAKSSEYTELQAFESSVSKLTLSKLIMSLTHLQWEAKMSPDSDLASKAYCQMQIAILASEIDRREALYTSGVSPEPKLESRGSRQKVKSLGGLV